MEETWRKGSNDEREKQRTQRQHGRVRNMEEEEKCDGRSGGVGNPEPKESRTVSKQNEADITVKKGWAGREEVSMMEMLKDWMEKLEGKRGEDERQSKNDYERIRNMRKKEEEWKAEKDRTEERIGELEKKMGEKYEDKGGGIQREELAGNGGRRSDEKRRRKKESRNEREEK